MKITYTLVQLPFNLIVDYLLSQSSKKLFYHTGLLSSIIMFTNYLKLIFVSAKVTLLVTLPLRFIYYSRALNQLQSRVSLFSANVSILSTLLQFKCIESYIYWKLCLKMFQATIYMSTLHVNVISVFAQKQVPPSHCEFY